MKLENSNDGILMLIQYFSKGQWGEEGGEKCNSVSVCVCVCVTVFQVDADQSALIVLIY